MKKKHLRLIVSHDRNCTKKAIIEDLKEKVKNLFISKREKIYILKDILIKIYRDYEITTGYDFEPYYIRAENKLQTIIRDKKVDYYYNLLKKFQKQYI